MYAPIWFRRVRVTPLKDDVVFYYPEHCHASNKPLAFFPDFSDQWNILDFITLFTYLVTLLLRIVTWAVSESVIDNRELVIAGSLYGLNTMFLTLRAFGHVMETVKGVGAIQIALFHIIGDVVTIFWQFIATILAFSIAITKIYVAEKSYISKSSGKDL